MNDPLTLERPRPSAARPLLGVTLLLVEDSRFASDALRLLCLRSGARLRRADCIASAHRHLTVYQPMVAMIDLGLPDGSGEDLIAELSSATPRIPVILGFSGDLVGEACAIAAGADGFVSKPLMRISEFQSAILSHLPRDCLPIGPREVSSEVVTPDPLALQDDLAHLRDLLSDDLDDDLRLYAAQFLKSIGKSAADPDLTESARALATSDASAATIGRVRILLDHRIRELPEFSNRT